MSAGGTVESMSVDERSGEVSRNGGDGRHAPGPIAVTKVIG